MRSNALISGFISPRLLLFFLSLALCAGTARAQVQVNLLKPADGAVVNEFIDIVAEVTSTLYELKSVTATVGTLDIPLKPASAPINGKQVWSSRYSLKELPRGEYAFTLRAEDTKGNIDTVQRAITKDALPVIHLLAPTQNAAAINEIRAAATCTDDDPQGCASLKVSFALEPKVACNQGDASCTTSPGALKVDTVIDTSAYARTKWGISFDATDSRGQTSSKVVMVNLVSGEHLRQLTSVVGVILDLSPNRILYRGTLTPDDPNSPHSLRIQDFSTGQETVLKSEEDSRRVTGAALTPQGAVFSLATENVPNSREFVEWRNGELIQHPASTSYYENGDTVVLAFPHENGTLLRNLTTGEEFSVPVGSNIQNIGPNGEVLLMRGSWGSTLYLNRGGVETKVAEGFLRGGGLTDGINVVYSESNTDTFHNHTIMLTTPAGDVVLIGTGRRLSHSPGTGYQVNNGWTAWLAPGASGTVTQVWVRDPQGASKQVTFFTTGALIDHLGPNGQLTFKSGGGLYLTDYATTTERRIASSEARAIYKSNGWYVIEVGTLFAVKGTFPAALGDVDENGKIDVDDAVLTLRMIVDLQLKTTDRVSRADVNRDTEVDISDVVKILRVVVKLDEGF